MADGPRILPEDLEIFYGKVLGSGGAGNVYEGALQRAGTTHPVAVKVLDKLPTDSNTPPRELLLLQQAQQTCPYVCKPYGFAVKNKKTCLVLALYKTSLAKLIEANLGAPGFLPCRFCAARCVPCGAVRSAVPASAFKRCELFRRSGRARPRSGAR
jgi:Protein tyrosine and serine/threonine kinase